MHELLSGLNQMRKGVKALKNAKKRPSRRKSNTRRLSIKNNNIIKPHLNKLNYSSSTANDIKISHIMITFKYYLLTISLILLIPIKPISIEWGIYKWVENNRIIQKPITQTGVTFTNPLFPHLQIAVTFIEQVIQIYNGYNASKYQIGQTGVVQVVANHGFLSLYWKNCKEINIQIICQTKLCLPQWKQNLEKQLPSNLCTRKQNKYLCKAEIGEISLSLNSKHGTLNKKSIQREVQLSISKYMQLYSIAQTTQNTQIVTKSLSAAMNSICLYQEPSYSDYHLGFCDQSVVEVKYNFKLAAFTIYLVSDFYYQLGKAIYLDYFDLYQKRLLYSFQDQKSSKHHPEHIEIFAKFGTPFQLSNQIQLLNSMFVTPMISQLGILHQQLNYRQARKLHPLLLKMMKQKWGTNSKLSALKSIYDQSMTADFKNHEYGQKLDQSVGKIAWIYHVVDTYTGILIKYHSMFMPIEQIKQMLTQHFSLLKILRIYLKEDKLFQDGDYIDIIQIDKEHRVYSKYVGYDSLLTYAYGLGLVYPEKNFNALVSKYGLKSSNQEQKPGDKKYKYRGDIHSYFNMKILSGINYRIQQDKKMNETRKKEIIGTVQKISAAIGNKVRDEYKNSKQIYTSWTANGKGKDKCEWGQLVTALFLRWA